MIFLCPSSSVFAYGRCISRHLLPNYSVTHPHEISLDPGANSALRGLGTRRAVRHCLQRILALDDRGSTLPQFLVCFALFPFRFPRSRVWSNAPSLPDTLTCFRVLAHHSSFHQDGEISHAHSRSLNLLPNLYAFNSFIHSFCIFLLPYKAPLVPYYSAWHHHQLRATSLSTTCVKFHQCE